MASDPIIDTHSTIGDAPSHELATRLRGSANDVTEPQRSRILHQLPRTLFISHSSADDAFIKETQEGAPKPGSIWWICGEVFYDPFYHSLKTGAAEDYERIVGLALLASRRVLVVWSENAMRSIYVRAELLIATESDKKVAAYAMRKAPPFPVAKVKVVHDCAALIMLLRAWREG